MSRLHLSILFLLVTSFSFGQNELKKMLQFAEEQYEKGDYVYAVSYYEQALTIDSNSVAILWKYAEALRAYKDYAKARVYYQKVYEKEEAAIYPSSLLQWALMEKQNGNYEKAIELFKLGKKKYAKDKKSYNYLKSRRELESCLWAQAELRDSAKVEPIQLPEGLNTKNSEFGHSIAYGNFYLSSLRAEKEGENEEVYDVKYRNKVFSFPWSDSLAEKKASDLKQLNESGIHTGNGCFSLDGKRFYFSQCGGSEAQFNCQIAVVNYSNGKWGTPTLLGELINEPGSNTTTPSIAFIDNEEWLIFSSNRDKSKGGMDLYFSVVKNEGNQFSKVKALTAANSIDNEISPWYDPSDMKLYFSSGWWDGFGGYDVHFLQLKNGTFSEPSNAGLPINSQANDLYFFKSGDSSFVSSNRLGVLYAKNPTCCSDIFGFRRPPIILPVSKKETLADLNKRLPVTLYFHNDIPDPRSRETSTKVNYINAYSDYIEMIPQYKQEYSKGLSADKISDAEEDIESFFIEYVEQGVKDLYLFQTLLLEELQKGLRIRLNVRGFASPLAKTEYNVALTQRRINSLINYLKVAENGVFAPYLNGNALNGGKLEIVGVPFGEYTADQITSDNPNDIKNSVFSRSAARERKIEIQSVSYLDADSLYFMIETDPSSLLLGKLKNKRENAANFRVISLSDKDLNIERIAVKDSVFTAVYNPILMAKKEQYISLKQTGELPIGIFSLPIDIYFTGYERPIRIMILGETE